MVFVDRVLDLRSEDTAYAVAFSGAGILF